MGLPLVAMACGGCGSKGAHAAAKGEGELAAILEPIRSKYDLPALGGALVTSDGVIRTGVTGFRKIGDPTPVALSDPFHLGSDTKAMTAVVIGHAIDEGKLTWTTTLGEVFPEWAGHIDPAFMGATVDQLLAHRASFPANGSTLPSFASSDPPDMREARAQWVEDALKKPPKEMPGTTFRYSNVGYVAAAAMVERRVSAPWEELIQREVLGPLGMKSAGFGAAGSPEKVDAPWPHMVFFEGKAFEYRRSFAPARSADNPATMSPAGRVHVSMEDWGRFVADQLASFEGHGKLLKAETYEHLHTPLFGGDYAGGWRVMDRPWGGGRVFGHTGSNVRNLATAWIAPVRHFAVLTATNQGGDRAEKGCDDAVQALITEREATARDAGAR